MERFCIILFAVLLVIGCQTTKPAGQQEAGAQGQGQAAQAQQSQQSQSNAPEQQAAPGGAQSRSVSRGGAAVSPAKLVSAVSSGINNLFSKVKALVK
ncbi:MAG TPA: hypothetical protein VMM82_15375, partial [Spirochaetia bacterium]|nr:hypothetical protein [Spirochaetia bacterium]